MMHDLGVQLRARARCAAPEDERAFDEPVQTTAERARIVSARESCSADSARAGAGGPSFGTRQTRRGRAGGIGMSSAHLAASRGAPSARRALLRVASPRHSPPRATRVHASLHPSSLSPFDARRSRVHRHVSSALGTRECARRMRAACAGRGRAPRGRWESRSSPPRAARLCVAAEPA